MKVMIKNIVLIVLLGTLLGVLTSLGQTLLPGSFKQLANSYSVWLFVSFIVGVLSTSYRWAAFGGAVGQYFAILGYYILTLLRFDSGFSISSNLLWIVGGTIAGPVVAIAGKGVTNGAKWKPYGISLITSLFFSEALYQFVRLHYIAEGFCFVAIGFIFLSIMLPRESKKLIVIMAAIPFTLILYVLYAYALSIIFSV